MADRPPALRGLGPEALRDLLARDAEAAEQKLRLLTRDELTHLSLVARMLSVQATRIAAGQPGE